MKRFKIQVHHNREDLSYLAVEQPDEIFILFSQTKGVEEKNFLMRVNGRWSGDMENKRLLTKLVEQIESSLSVQM